MAFKRSLISTLLFAATARMVQANPLILERQAPTTNGATTTGATTTGLGPGLFITVISGTTTTMSTSLSTNTGTTTTPATTPSTSNSDGSTTTQASSAPSSSAPVNSGENQNIIECKDDSLVICSPADGQVLYTGDSYFFTWNVKKFEANTTFQIGLKYNNGGAGPYLSPPVPAKAGITQVLIEPKWLDGWDQQNLTLFYATLATNGGNSPTTSLYNVTITTEPTQHLPASMAKPSFDKKSLMIALPIVLVFVILVVLGLFFGMKKQRKIGFGALRGRGGYGTNKSRRQRMGVEKGAVRLEDRNPSPPSPSNPASTYHDDDERSNKRGHNVGIQPGPNQLPPLHSRDLSLGSLVN